MKWQDKDETEQGKTKQEQTRQNKDTVIAHLSTLLLIWLLIALCIRNKMPKLHVPAVSKMTRNSCLGSISKSSSNCRVHLYIK